MSHSGVLYEGRQLEQITFPVGGVGSGGVGFTGYGSFVDFSIRNRPDNHGRPDFHGAVDAAFGTIKVGEEARLLEGPMPAPRIYQFGMRATGHRRGGHEGFPRFSEASFEGRFPFGIARLSDSDLPVEVEAVAWSPFVPSDVANSSRPVALIEYRVRNVSDRPHDVQIGFHLSNLATGGSGGVSEALPRAIRFRGEGEVDAHLFVDDPNAIVQGAWFAGGWWDWTEALWRDVVRGIQGNAGAEFAEGQRSGGSIAVNRRVEAGATTVVTFGFAWHFPEPDWSHGHRKDAKPKWRVGYAANSTSSADAVEATLADLPDLKRRTEAFAQALWDTDLPKSVPDAVSAGLSILRSPTVLIEENGWLYGWEGCFVDGGCCHGSCTHVWNYAQALPHVFPSLERTMREREWKTAMDDEGHVNFRAAIPAGPTDHGYHPATDGQLGGVMKLWRDYRICGDREWLAEMAPLARRALDYAIRKWDPDRRGVLEGCQHNTYDVEFWGPTGMLGSVYVGALSAMAQILGELDDPAASGYAAMAQEGAKRLEERCYRDGRYVQDVDVEAFRRVKDPKSMGGQSSEHGGEPKYQVGEGVLADGVIGAWMMDLYGVPNPMTQETIASHLAQVFAHNFHESLKGRPNRQRPGYAMGAEEGGLQVCTWPDRARPAFPFPYCDEVWTGIEYQVAAHLIRVGMVDEGLKVVETARKRSDGIKRNPFSEWECGNYYARAMSGFAVPLALSGFDFDARTGTLRLEPRLERVRCLFCVEGAFGTVEVSSSEVRLEALDGAMRIERIVLDGKSMDVAQDLCPGSSLELTVP